MSGGVQSDISFAALFAIRPACLSDCQAGCRQVGLNCQEMLPRKQTRLIVGEFNRGLFDSLGSKETRKRIDFLLSYIRRTTVLSLLGGFLVSLLQD